MSLFSRKTPDLDPLVDGRREANFTHTCVHERNWKAAREQLQEKGEVIRLLLELEPGLDKYREEGPWGHSWDMEGMKAALEFRRLQEASKRYATPVVSETTTEKTKE